ncbi:hypothetical protein Q8F55_009191 [Vanrija albida]|uniref:Uncharacterized protein n=1 Tax=Vanrija albida TaxID=181172 RepID=A0ABR3PSX2_9TREE
MVPVSVLAATLAALAVPAQAHIALWHPSMYGFGTGWDNSEMAVPLNQNAPKNGPKGWWFHGKIDEPPAEGEIAQLPAGGKWHTQVSCDKHFTTWGNPNERYGEQHYACDEYAMLHVGTGKPGDGKTVQTDIKGCALAIAYESDPHKVNSDSMVVFSVNYQCPWFKEVEFEIPADLPPCPPGGCHCSWNWSHSPAGGGSEQFMTLFKCNIKGATGTRALTTQPKVANKCPWDRNNCTIGAKTPFIFNQAEGNNIFQDFTDPPYYNWEYGFADGAQNDLWERDTTVTNTEWAPNPWESYAAGAHPAVTPAVGKNVPPVQDGVTLVSPTWKTGPKTYPPGEDPSDPANLVQAVKTSVSLQPWIEPTAVPSVAASPLAAKPVSGGAAAGEGSGSSSATPTSTATPASGTPTADAASSTTTTGSGEAVTATPVSSSSGSASDSGTAVGTDSPSSSSGSGTGAPTDSPSSASSGSGTAVGTDAPSSSGSGTAVVTGSPSSGSGTAVVTGSPSSSGSGTAVATNSASSSGSGTVVASPASGTGTGAPTGNSAASTTSAGAATTRPPSKCRPKQRKRRASF